MARLWSRGQAIFPGAEVGAAGSNFARRLCWSWRHCILSCPSSLFINLATQHSLEYLTGRALQDANDHEETEVDEGVAKSATILITYHSHNF